MKQLFLPLGLLLAIFFALLLPVVGIFLSENSGLKFLIFIIFQVSGYQTGVRGLSLDRWLFHIFLAAAAISLILSPLLGLLMTRLINLPDSLAMGLIIISAVPPTISSGIVITEVSRGNAVLALFITVSLNLLGIFTMPFILDLCLKAAGPVDIDQTGLLVKMLFFVLLPFGIGKLTRNVRGKSRVSPNWRYVNSVCVILVVYGFLAVSKNEFSGLGVAEYGMILATVSLLHLLLLAINGQAGKMLPPAGRLQSPGLCHLPENPGHRPCRADQHQIRHRQRHHRLPHVPLLPALCRLFSRLIPAENNVVRGSGFPLNTRQLHSRPATP